MSERVRLEMLVQRDGLSAAREWARAIAALYRHSMNDPASFASQPEWKSRFEPVIRELEQFAATGKIPESD